MLRSVKTLPSAWEIRDCVITSLPLIRAGYHKAGLAIMLLLLLSEECGSSAPCESHLKIRPARPRVRQCTSTFSIPAAGYSPRRSPSSASRWCWCCRRSGSRAAGCCRWGTTCMHTAGARVLCFRLVFTRCGVLSPSVGLLCCYCCSSLEAAVVGVTSAVGAPHFSDFPREWESLGAAVMFTGIACLACSASIFEISISRTVVLCAAVPLHPLPPARAARRNLKSCIEYHRMVSPVGRRSERGY